MELRFYQLRIRLLEIEPEIWRRFVVPGDISLDRLHDVIQIVMGWQDYHLHEFTIGTKRYTGNPQEPDDGFESGRFRLIDLIKQKGRTFQYVYDFGDNWSHEVEIEESHFDPDELEIPIFCLEGQMACPPEDVGGLPGFMSFCEAMADVDDPEHKRLKEWYGDTYNPGEFQRPPRECSTRAVPPVVSSANAAVV